jgi:uncharacterized protein YfiM (DUF2279 family)
MRFKRTILATSTAAAALVAACGGGGGSGKEISAAKGANGNLSTIHVLGNRADLVSGGQALVEISLPDMAKATYGDVKVVLNGSDVTSSFAVRNSGRYMGLVQGLREGENVIVARVPNGPGARLTLTNHDRGGPLISGAQVQPWLCPSSWCIQGYRISPLLRPKLRS